MIKVSESITNSVTIDPIERYYGAIMIADSLDNKGAGVPVEFLLSIQ